eukprot:gene12201-biopygen11
MEGTGEPAPLTCPFRLLHPFDCDFSTAFPDSAAGGSSRALLHVRVPLAPPVVALAEAEPPPAQGHVPEMRIWAEGMCAGGRTKAGARGTDESPYGPSPRVLRHGPTDALHRHPINTHGVRTTGGKRHEVRRSLQHHIRSVVARSEAPPNRPQTKFWAAGPSSPLPICWPVCSCARATWTLARVFLRSHDLACGPCVLALARLGLWPVCSIARTTWTLARVFLRSHDLDSSPSVLALAQHGLCPVCSCARTTWTLARVFLRSHDLASSPCVLALARLGL